jgi:factor associated with neutral sphingomyelinase activation
MSRNSFGGKQNPINFFWDKKLNKNRSRFNLLLLEYGEYLLEDISASYFPVPTQDLSSSFEVKDCLKLPGRLKLCTRSIIFEPSDTRYPLTKFPFKSILGDLELFHLKQKEIDMIDSDFSGFFTFAVQSIVEIKENNKVCPYKQMDFIQSDAHRFVFALVHADIHQFMVKVEQLRNIFTVSLKDGFGAANQLLKPFFEDAQLWTLKFDSSLLVNFHEKLLFSKPVAVKRIRPLIVNPGSLMVTESRIYFQPAQLNNIGDSVLQLEIRSISRMFRRRYLLQQTGIEFVLSNNCSYLFITDSKSVRDEIFNILLSVPAMGSVARGVEGSIVNENGQNSARSSIASLCKAWQLRKISTFEYLMALNCEADRSLNDLTQYPVSFCQI